MNSLNSFLLVGLASVFLSLVVYLTIPVYVEPEKTYEILPEPVEQLVPVPRSIRASDHPRTYDPREDM